jgi:hypothetical protein
MSNITRRNFVVQSAAALAAARALSAREALTANNLGVQLYTVRDTITKTPEKDLKAIEAIGYKKVAIFQAYLPSQTLNFLHSKVDASERILLRVDFCEDTCLVSYHPQPIMMSLVKIPHTAPIGIKTDNSESRYNIYCFTDRVLGPKPKMIHEAAA